MSLKDLPDDEIKVLLENPEEYIRSKENAERLIGFDSVAKRRFVDIMKYDLELSEEAIRQKLEEVAAIKLREIDVFN